MLLFVMRKIFSVVIAVAVIATSAMTALAESGEVEIAVLLPVDISFEIVILKSSREGIVCSNEFEISNNGRDDVTVEISEVELQIEDTDNYYIADTRELPETGNNIFMELLCLGEDEPSPIVMTDTPSGTVYTYNLKSGESGKFKFDGVVNEFGEVLWDGTVVEARIHFNIISNVQVALDEDDDSVADRDESSNATMEPPTQDPAYNTNDSSDGGSIVDMDGTDTQAADLPGAETGTGVGHNAGENTVSENEQPPSESAQPNTEESGT